MDDLTKYHQSLEDFLSKGKDEQEKEVSAILDTITVLQGFEVTKELLTKSKIGVAMNKARKCDDERVQKAATSLLLKWRDVMVPTGSPATGASHPTSKRKADDGEEKESVTKKPLVKSSTSSPSVNSEEGFDLKSFYIGDAVRDKCFELLVNALMVDQLYSSSNESISASIDSSISTENLANPDEIVINTAQSIEKCLFAEFQAVTPAYKAKFRSKYLNLKDKKNPTLREALISGLINAERFCQMTSAEMASDERKKVDAKIAEQNLLNSQAARDTAAETDQFKCSRCHQRRCKYYQLQTRSADEPMTTFVTCVNCGNRWRRVYWRIWECADCGRPGWD